MGEFVRGTVLLASASPELAAGAGLVASAGARGQRVIEACLGIGEHTGGDGSKDEKEVGLHFCWIERGSIGLCVMEVSLNWNEGRKSKESKLILISKWMDV